MNHVGIEKHLPIDTGEEEEEEEEMATHSSILFLLG